MLIQSGGIHTHCPEHLCIAVVKLFLIDGVLRSCFPHAESALVLNEKQWVTAQLSNQLSIIPVVVDPYVCRHLRSSSFYPPANCLFLMHACTSGTMANGEYGI